MRPHDWGLIVVVGVATAVCTGAAMGQIHAMPPSMYGDNVHYQGGYTQERGADLPFAPAGEYRSGGGTEPYYAASHGTVAPNVPPPPGLPTPSTPPYGPPPPSHGLPAMPPYEPHALPAAQPYGPAVPHAYEPSPPDRDTASAYASAVESQGGPPLDSQHETAPWGHSIPTPSPSHAPPPPDAPSVRSTFSTPGHTYPASPYWTWQVAPDGIIYKSYLAGGREPRMGSQWFYERDHGWLWDSTLGARVGLIRYGTADAAWPEGWQLDFEGAAFPRLDLENDRDLISVDFRFGFPLTFREGPWEWKFAYYHLCAHMGDEYLQRYPDATRLNFVRDALVLGLAFRPHPDLRLYAEAGYAPWVDGGSEPWEFQYGVDYSPMEPSGFRGAPFLAVNGRIREEVDFGGNFTAQAGWQWRGETGNLFRFGAHYFNGMSDQYQFFRTFEEHIGLGLWYDF